MRRIAFWLTLLMGGTSSLTQAGEPEIRLAVSPSRGNGFVVGSPIEIRCVVENVGALARVVKWQENHEHHGRLPYPAAMTASVWDSNGAQLVRDVTQYVAWSSFFNEMPGDSILLPPGAKFFRVVRLDQIIGLQVPRLPAGTYRVQLRLPEATSNLLTINVRDESGPATPSSATTTSPQRNGTP